MCRNIFLALSVIGCAILLPIFYFKSIKDDDDQSLFLKLTPFKLWQNPLWGMVVVAYLINFVICGFLWWNYRRVLQLRRLYFESEEFQNSLHARTLMVMLTNQNSSLPCMRDATC